MLPEERLEAITAIVNERRSITNQELTQLLEASESTIRRDINTLSARGKVIRVHGGAMAISEKYERNDLRTSERREKNAEAKKKIAVYAAGKIQIGDVVYIDAGTTTEYLAAQIIVRDAIYVTNGIEHAKILSNKGITAHLIAGVLKPITEAVIGAEAVECLQRFRFSVGFFGANGVSKAHGITTPDINEAVVKHQAFACCQKRYVLCDSSKFDKICTAKFANFYESVIITEKADKKYIGDHVEVAE